MAEQGLQYAGPLVAGKIARFGKDLANWYVFYPDGTPAGAFGSWKEGDWHKWCTKSEERMSEAERAAHRARLEHIQQVREIETAERQRAARIEATKQYDLAAECHAHPYTSAKGVRPHGLKVNINGQLVVPLMDLHGTVHSLQYIDHDGKKKFMPGGAITGHFFEIPGSDTLVICEGYATGASIFEATGCTVVVAFNAGNLLAVAREVRAARPSASIIICGDNDAWTDGNPGKTKAEAAGAEINARVVIPTFQNIPPDQRPTDFNDLMALESPQAIQTQIIGRKAYHVDLSQWDASVYQGPAPERVYLVNNTIPAAAVTIIAAAGDAGKGLLMLDLALKVVGKALAAYAFGNRVTRHGAAVILTAEDDKDEVHRRLENVDTQGIRYSCKGNLIIVPLPNAGGPMPLVVSGRQGPETTRSFHELREQLLAIKDLVLVVIDPLASFVTADINADPAVGAFVMGCLSSLATDTGAAVLIPHHMTKGSDRGKATARNSIRGSTAIVDGARAAYALWAAEEIDAVKACALADVPYSPNAVFYGQVVKSNGPADRTIKTFVRNAVGLLQPFDRDVFTKKPSEAGALNLLVNDIAKAAEKGRPFTTRGQAGVWERREELDPLLRDISDHKARAMVTALLDSGRIGKGIAQGSTMPKWLDVPGGQFQLGIGEFELGFVAQPGMAAARSAEIKRQEDDTP